MKTKKNSIPHSPFSILHSPFSIQFGSKTIDFYLEFSDRKTLGITVTPEIEVLVKAPTDTSMEKVKDKIIKKAPWIIKQLSFFHSFEPKLPKRKYISGETHLYLGRQYRLKVVNEKLKVKSGKLEVNNETVKLKGQFIEVFTTDLSRVEKLLEKWYLEKANEKIKPLAQELLKALFQKTT